MIFYNPVLTREFKSLLRTRRAALMLFAYVALLCALVFLLWPRTGVYSLNAEKSRTLFMVFLLGQLLLVVFFSPAFAATAITSEKERGTFDMLYASLVRPMAIALGKLVSSVSFPLLLVIASLPVTALCTLLGGVGLREMALAYAVIAGSALFFGLASLCASAICRRNMPAVVASYVIVVTISAGTWIPSLCLANWREGKPVLDRVRSLSPFTAMISIVQEQFWEVLGEAPSTVVPWQWFIGFALLGSAVAATIFVVLLMSPPRQAMRERIAKFADRQTAVKRKLTFPFYLIDPLKRKKMIGDYANPIFVKELRSRVLGQPDFLIRMTSICLIVSLGILILVGGQYGALSPDAVRVVAIIFQLSLVVLMTPSVAASALTGEREGATLDLLRTTLLPPRTVIFGKLRANFIYVFIFLVTSFPVFIALGYLEVKGGYWRVGAWAAILVATMTFFIASGLFFSSLVRTTATATACSYGLALLICGGTLVTFLLIDRIPSYAVFWLLCLNPFIAAVQVSCDTLLEAPIYHGLWYWNVYLMCAIVFLFVLVAVIRFRKAYVPEP